MRKRGQGGAPGRGKEVRRRRRCSYSLTTSDLAGDVYREAALRRGIASVWERLGQERRKGAREGSLGYL
jgi:hypothetical protein